MRRTRLQNELRLVMVGLDVVYKATLVIAQGEVPEKNK